MSKHTPGPWEAISNLVRTRCTSDGNGGFLIAECPPNIGDRLENARLIAAAPELLEALRMWMDIHEKPAGFVGKYGKALDAQIHAHQLKVDAAADAARAAIAKATGGAA